jgi:acid phosphatase family membrane protein YuiD
LNGWEQLINNKVLIVAIIAWGLAQFLKVPIEYIRYRRRNWALWFSSGGMPSSHSALVTAITLSIGLFYGFDTPVFALSTGISMVVIYDAAGVRREAGRHAEKINVLINEFFSGQTVSEKQLKEIIGHTPAQVSAGILLGAVLAYGFWWVWSL